MGFNKLEVGHLFRNIRQVREQNTFGPHRIYNVDESGLSTVPTKLQKVLPPKGSRRVGKMVSSERDKNTTVVCSCNAGGDFVSPFFIFTRQRMLPELLNGCPPGSAAVARKSGWMTSDVFVFRSLKEVLQPAV